MTADEAIATIRVKIDRAKHHIVDLERQISAFLDTKPYKVGAKRDPETRKPIYYIVSVAETPISIAAVAGDACQNLRSALDHLAFRLVVIGLGGTIPNHPEYIGYPIADSQAQYPSFRDGKVKGARQEAKNAIDATKPYPGGNDTLWRLHKLNNIDKHRLLLTVGSAFRSLDIGAEMQRLMKETFPERKIASVEMPMFIRPADRLFPLKAGDELYIGGPDHAINEKMQFRFDVALGEPGIIEGEPLHKTIHDMADLVDNVVLSFKPLFA